MIMYAAQNVTKVHINTYTFTICNELDPTMYIRAISLIVFLFFQINSIAHKVKCPYILSEWKHLSAVKEKRKIIWIRMIFATHTTDEFRFEVKHMYDPFTLHSAITIQGLVYSLSRNIFCGMWNWLKTNSFKSQTQPKRQKYEIAGHFVSIKKTLALRLRTWWIKWTAENENERCERDKEWSTHEFA